MSSDFNWGEPPEEDTYEILCKECGHSRQYTKPGLKPGGMMFLNCRGCHENTIHEVEE